MRGDAAPRGPHGDTDTCQHHVCFPPVSCDLCGGGRGEEWGRGQHFKSDTDAGSPWPLRTERVSELLKVYVSVTLCGGWVPGNTTLAPGQGQRRFPQRVPENQLDGVRRDPEESVPEPETFGKQQIKPN